MNEKLCSKCGRWLPESKFHWTTNAKGYRYRRADCRDCCAMAAEIRRHKTRQAYNAHHRDYRALHPEKVRTTEKRYRLRRALRQLEVV